MRRSTDLTRRAYLVGQSRVALARARLLRLAAGGSTAREAALTASRGMASVASEAATSDRWSRRIAASSAEVQQLIGDIADRMGDIGFATEEYAATAEQLTGAVRSFRLDASPLSEPQRSGQAS